jgi:hypothetical protein
MKSTISFRTIIFKTPYPLIRITVLSAYFYTFMEWLFFVTKPSSLSILTFFDKLEVLFITGGVIALLLVVTFNG